MTITGTLFKKGFVVDIEDNGGKRTLKDENGKALSFNTRVAALNFMAKMGWELASVYCYGKDRISGYTYYVFKKSY
ncbi:hypothetical protein GCM10027516_22140 [Niabella aquatica]